MIRNELRQRRPSLKFSLALVAGVATVASAVATLAIATGGSEPQPPPLSAKPGAPSSPPGGEPVDVTTDAVQIGRVRVLPAGSVPNPAPAVLIPKPGDRQSGWSLSSVEEEATARRAGFEISLPPAPDGLRLVGGGFDAFVDSSGISHIWREGYRFESPDYFAIEVTVRKLLPDSSWEIVGYASESQHGISRVDVAGVPVAVTHAVEGSKVQSATQAWFSVGDLLVYADAPGYPVERFTAYLVSLVESLQER